MAYIGKTPVIGNFVKLDAISVVNGQASYTMQNGGANFTAYETVNQFLVSLNGILQAPTTSFTVSGSTITFASNLVTGDVIDFILVLGNTLDIGTPSDNTVSLAKLTATGTKDATTFLRGDNTFAEVGGGGKILQVVSALDGSTRTTNSTSFVTASNTCSLNITPSATSSKILLMFQSVIQMPTQTGHMAYITIFKDGTNLVGNEGMSGVGNYAASSTSGYIFGAGDIKYIDSPATTSQITYDIRLRSENSSYSLQMGSGGAGATDSTLIAMEIGA